MLTTTVVLLLLAAPAPVVPDRYAHPVTGKRIENVPKVVVEADPNGGEFFCCLATLALHQGKKLDLKALDTDKKDGKLNKNVDAMVAYFKKQGVLVTRQENKADAIKAVDIVAKTKRPVAVFIMLKREFEETAIGVAPLYPFGVLLTYPTANRGLCMVCLLYADPDTVTEEERYVCIEDMCHPGKPEWIKHKDFMAKRLVLTDKSSGVLFVD